MTNNEIDHETRRELIRDLAWGDHSIGGQLLFYHHSEHPELVLAEAVREDPGREGCMQISPACVRALGYMRYEPAAAPFERRLRHCIEGMAADRRHLLTIGTMLRKIRRSTSATALLSVAVQLSRYGQVETDAVQLLRGFGDFGPAAEAAVRTAFESDDRNITSAIETLHREGLVTIPEDAIVEAMKRRPLDQLKVGFDLPPVAVAVVFARHVQHQMEHPAEADARAGLRMLLMRLEHWDALPSLLEDGVSMQWNDRLPSRFEWLRKDPERAQAVLDQVVASGSPSAAGVARQMLDQLAVADRDDGPSQACRA